MAKKGETDRREREGSWPVPAKLELLDESGVAVRYSGDDLIVEVTWKVGTSRKASAMLFNVGTQSDSTMDEMIDIAVDRALSQHHLLGGIRNP